MKVIEPQELKAALQKKDPQELLVDVRDEESFGEGHIPGAVNIPVSSLQDRIDDLKQYKTVYVSCGGGSRSGKACAILEGTGVNAVQFPKGMRGWKGMGFDIVTD